MIKKPWPLIIIGILHILEPLAKLPYYSYVVTQLGLRGFIDYQIKNQSFLDIFEFYSLFPIVGICILLVKRWSFVLFLLIEMRVLFFNFSFLIENQSKLPFMLVATLPMLTIFNILIVAYFIVPSIRNTFLKSELRWWESKPRFKINISGTLKQNGHKSVKIKIDNISEGGMFISLKNFTPNDQPIVTEFTFGNLDFSLQGIICHKRTTQGKNIGFGIRFLDLDKKQKKNVKNLVESLHLLGYEMYPPPTDYLKEMVNNLKSAA